MEPCYAKLYKNKIRLRGFLLESPFIRGKKNFSSQCHVCNYIHGDLLNMETNYIHGDLLNMETKPICKTHAFLHKPGKIISGLTNI